jgi:beta-lactam-binding protein with PASTA domain
MRIFTVILVAFITAVAASTGTAYLVIRLGWFNPPEVPRQPVPDLVGLSEADAKTNLATLGFSMLVAGREIHATAEPGTVVRQTPSPGELAPVGQAVRLTFALPPPKLPDVVGKKLSAATEVMEQAGYKVRVAKAVASDKHAEGLVASQSPAPGTPLQKGAKVVLRPSAGAAAVEVPKLVGMGLQKAKKEAEQAKLKVKVQWVELAETTSYVVLRQKPEAGEPVARDSEVLVVVNRGD